MATMSRPGGNAGLVLSGGGVRGAYEVGVVGGIIEALGRDAAGPSPFSVFAGTSVGAINVAYLASHADRGDLAIEGLEKLWTGLELDVYLRLKVFEHIPILGAFARRLLPLTERTMGWSVLDSKPLQRLVENGVDWDNLHRNADAGIVRSLIVAALNIGTGRTTMFSELGPDTDYRPSKDPLRTVERCRINADHVLASAALPGVFPARRVGGAYFCDGGLRFNTPIAPAVRSGADRLVIIPVTIQGRSTEQTAASTLLEYPKPTFLLGKLLNALLADPLDHDLQVMARFNRLIEILETTLSPEELARVHEEMTRSRGAPYRSLDALVIRPTEDIGLLAGEYLRTHQPGSRLRGAEGWLFRMARRRTAVKEADWAAYVLFDGAFARQLIDLGRRDARARADEIREFFTV